MKLRIYDNSIRLRLTRPEVDRLAQGETIRGSVELSPQGFGYVLAAAEKCTAPTATFGDGCLQVVVPRSIAVGWAATGQVSIEALIAASSPDRPPVQLVIEKDFRCLHGPGEDQQDCFPNPLENGPARSETRGR